MGIETVFTRYLHRLAEVAAAGDAREESFYSSLEQMIGEAAHELSREGVHVTTLPKKTEAGNPDFRVWDGTSRIVGYLEAKKPDAASLDSLEDTEQLRRYRSTFPNLILTNFLEFRLYRDGEMIAQTLIGRPAVLTRLGKAPPVEKPEKLQELLERFLEFSLPGVRSAEELAGLLAKRTRFLRDVVAEILAEEDDGGSGMLAGFFEAFQHFLIGGLTPETFADLYAQTLTYGLFAARVRAQNGFSRKAAFDHIPPTIGVLRDLFRFISQGDPPPQLEWIVDDIAEVLAQTDVSGLLNRYYKNGKGGDPIVHFYETFLAKYDPAERERRGVYYTPEPVVSYIVRSVHQLLKSQFGLADGLADRSVTLLDPAAGTMTFVARAVREAVAEFETKYGAGARAEFIRDHVLPNFHAFELMMAPYAVGHLKMSFLLEELGHRLADKERVRFYLTNTLDVEELESSKLPGLSSLAEESRLAGEVKKQKPILVIIGNPPYSGHSANASQRVRTIISNGGKEKRIKERTFIGGLIEDYKKVDGAPLKEKNPKWLQDDYVKFLRFAQWKIDQAGRGIVGMITNHSYLDNPTFRGMRQSLLNSFDDIFILDLHGAALKRETCPDGTPDHNVFDIRQGVAIAFFIKSGKKKKAGARLRHAEFQGKREDKYGWLEARDLESTKWSRLKPRSASYLFVPRDDALETHYHAFVPLPKIFPVNSVGIVTARDGLTVHWSAEEAWKTVVVFSRMDPELAREGYQLGQDARDWKVSFAQKDLLDSGPAREKIAPLLYRPFDVRHTYYTGKSRGFLCMPRPEVMNHMLAGENLALIAPRRVEHQGPWRHAFVTDRISEHVAVSLKTIDYHFPLYLYPNHKQMNFFSKRQADGKTPNLAPDLLDRLKSVYGRKLSPESLFQYIYAVLYAPAYREKYAEFLRMDFPRIPFPSSPKLFPKVAELGRRLCDLHLLRSPELDPPSARFEGEGSGLVGDKKGCWPRFDPEAGRVWVNEEQHFAPVAEAVWDCRVGGYQVGEKWLKDRKGRRLSLEEIQTYCRIVTALGLTIEIQQSLDALYPQIEAERLEVESWA